MADPLQSEEPTANPDIRKEEPTVVHNIRQILGCLPILGLLAVGILGLVAFGIGVSAMSRVDQPAWLWLIGANIGLIASSIGFGVLGWIVWSNR